MPASWTPVTDGVDDVLAEHVNTLYDEVELGTFRGWYANTVSSSDNVTLTDADMPIQYIDPSGNAINVYLPAAAGANHAFIIVNTADAAETITVLTSSSDTVDTVAQNEAKFFVSDDTTWAALSGGGAGGSGGIGQNFCINGEMRVSQRGTTFTSAAPYPNNDDVYLLDLWNLISDGNDIVDVSQSTEAPTGFSRSIKLEVETANKQFGIVHFLEYQNAIRFSGQAASLSFWARMAAADDNTHSLKAVVLAWSSTADTITSDVVGTWAATITPAANWTAENAAASNTLTTSWQEFKIENIAIDTANMANLAILFYCDQTDGAIDDAIYISGVKLEIGAAATSNIPRLIGQELSLCQRYFYLWGYENSDTGTGFRMFGNGGAGIYEGQTIRHPVPMRSIPVGVKNGTWGVTNCGQPTLGDPSSLSANVFVQVTANGTFDFYPDSADDNITFTAEL